MSIKSEISKVEAPKPKFVAPDGGWGWVIAIAVGFSYFCALAVFLCFGLIFRTKFEQLKITPSQTTTILNVNSAVKSCTGLASGPLFRKFSFRQVSFVGSMICSISICILAFAETYISVLILYSFMEGIGVGLVMAASSLALNMYFEEKRRIAVGLAWTIAGIGAMISPQVVAALMPIYGSTGTCLLFGGFMFNAIACALLLRPIEIHTSKKLDFSLIATPTDPENIEDSSKIRYLGKSNEAINDLEKQVSSMKKTQARNSIVDVVNEYTGLKSNYDNDYKGELINGERKLPEIRRMNGEGTPIVNRRRRLCGGLVSFFDLDLFRDLIYVNLMIGVVISSFAELNFIFLSPYILSAYDLTDNQVAAAMSVISGVDLVGRMTTPFITSRFRLQNKTYFLIGIGIAAIGRLILAYVKTYSIILTIGILMGIGRAVTIIFQALVIPSHVPLARLAGASGIQMMTSGMIFMMLGPLVGWIREYYCDYASVLHFLNFLTFLTIVSWTLQAWCMPTKR